MERYEANEMNKADVRDRGMKLERTMDSREAAVEVWKALKDGGRDGRIIQAGESWEVYATPATEAVATPAVAVAAAPKKARKFRKPTGRSGRWIAAVEAARAKFEAVQAAAEELTEALSELKSVQEEYQEWRDGIPENLENGATAEKLDAVTGIDLEVEVDLTDVETVLDEAEGADLPMGFGRD